MNYSIILLFNPNYINCKELDRLVDQLKGAGVNAFPLVTYKELPDIIQIVDIPSSHVLES